MSTRRPRSLTKTEAALGRGRGSSRGGRKDTAGRTPGRWAPRTPSARRVLRGHAIRFNQEKRKAVAAKAATGTGSHASNVGSPQVAVLLERMPHFQREEQKLGDYFPIKQGAAARPESRERQAHPPERPRPRPRRSGGTGVSLCSPKHIAQEAVATRQHQGTSVPPARCPPRSQETPGSARNELRLKSSARREIHFLCLATSEPVISKVQGGAGTGLSLGDESPQARR